MSTKVPDLQIDLAGQSYGGAYWSNADYRFGATREGDEILMWLENSSGGVIDDRQFTERQVRALMLVDDAPTRIRPSDAPPTVDELASLGVNTVVSWMWGDDEDEVDLGGRLDEIQAWLGYALGDETWDGGEDWEW